MTTTVQQRRALRLLADADHGRTVADLLALGFTNALLDRLARDGLATIQPGTMRRHAADYRRLGGDHRRRSASACRQPRAAGRMNRDARFLRQQPKFSLRATAGT
jgi:hypothetical protein